MSMLAERPLTRRRMTGRRGSLDADRFGLGEETQPGAGDSPLRRVLTDKVHPNPGQPRTRFDEEAIDRLATSMQSEGQLSPLVVTEHQDLEGEYMIVAGERRWRAAVKAGMPEVEVLLRETAGTDLLLKALAENFVREDLSPIEEAEAFRGLVEEHGLTQAEVAKRFGVRESEMSKRLRLLDLHDTAKELIDSGQLTKRHGGALLAEPDWERQRTLAMRAVREQWSVARLEQEIKPEIRVRRTSGRPPISADHRAAADALQEGIQDTTGLNMRVEPRQKGFAFALRVDTLEDARAFAERLGANLAQLAEL